MHKALLVGALLLSGCARFGVQAPLSAKAPSFPGQQAQLVSVLRNSYSACLPTTAAAAAGLRCTDAALDNFTGAGIALADIYCDEFLRAANQSARKRRFSRGFANDAGAAVAGLLNLAKAGANALTASTVGFSAIDSSFRNYDDSFMVDADLAKLRSLVLSAQDNMRLKIEQRPPRTLYAAESKIRRYAGICSFLGMQGLLNASVAEKTAAIDQENEARQPTVGMVAPQPIRAQPAAVLQAAPVAPLPPPG